MKTEPKSDFQELAAAIMASGKHSKLPFYTAWTKGGHFCLFSGERIVARFSEGIDEDLRHEVNKEANAAFIVRACNEHAALIAIAENSKVQKQIVDEWLEVEDESAMRLVSRLRGLWTQQDKALENLTEIRK